MYGKSQHTLIFTLHMEKLNCSDHVGQQRRGISLPEILGIQVNPLGIYLKYLHVLVEHL